MRVRHARIQYIYIYIYIYIYPTYEPHTCMHTYMHAYIHTCIHTHTHVGHACKRPPTHNIPHNKTRANIWRETQLFRSLHHSGRGSSLWSNFSLYSTFATGYCIVLPCAARFGADAANVCDWRGGEYVYVYVSVFLPSAYIHTYRHVHTYIHTHTWLGAHAANVCDWRGGKYVYMYVSVRMYLCV
jgi:hypothetical protein